MDIQYLIPLYCDADDEEDGGDEGHVRGPLHPGVQVPEHASVVVHQV